MFIQNSQLLLPVKTTDFTPMMYAFFLHGSVYVDSSDTLVMHKKTSQILFFFSVHYMNMH